MLDELETLQNYYPVLIDSDGNKIYASENLSFISDFPPNGMEIKNTIDAALQSETGFYPLKNGKYVYFSENPIINIKTIIFFDNKESLHAEKLISGRHILLLVCSIIILTAFILVIFTKHFKDFPKIMQSVRKYGIKDYSPRINSYSNDSMGMIAGCLDNLGEKYKSNQRNS